MRTVAALLSIILAAAPFGSADAQDASVPAKQLFGKVSGPAELTPESIGFYARGCLAGGKELAIDGPAWQAMRLSRNRNWGHPRLVALVERLATEARKHDGWPGLLVGDISQPRGGPMLTGHASHQIGLDADIWLTPMPDRRLTEKEREEISAISMLGSDKLSVDPKSWTDSHARIIRRAASYPEVDRLFVHPAIKKALCEGADRIGSDRSWLRKVRPYWGHHYHFHVRIGCPSASATCKDQAAPPPGDGCGKELNDWLALIAAPPKPKKPSKPKPPLTLAQLPDQCPAVLAADEPDTNTASAPLEVPAPVRAIRAKAQQQ